jgi:hypothetical protein
LSSLTQAEEWVDALFVCAPKAEVLTTHSSVMRKLKGAYVANFDGNIGYGTRWWDSRWFTLDTTHDGVCNLRYGATPFAKTCFSVPAT